MIRLFMFVLLVMCSCASASAQSTNNTNAAPNRKATGGNICFIEGGSAIWTFSDDDYRFETSDGIVRWWGTKAQWQSKSTNSPSPRDTSELNSKTAVDQRLKARLGH